MTGVCGASILKAIIIWRYYGNVPDFEAPRKKEDINDCLESILLEQNDGSLRMLIRTHLGVEESFSQDGGNILMAKITEEDIFAEKIISEKSALRILLSSV